MKSLVAIIVAFLFLNESGISQIIHADTVVRVSSSAINDSTQLSAEQEKLADSLRRKHIKKTIIRSAIIPGWGQITNKQVWKLPFVYAAVGIPVAVFFYNVKEYKNLRSAYIYKSDTIPANDILIPQRYNVLSTGALRSYRDEFRKNVDYSVLVFLLGWGLNVADAAVFAHLRYFDVSDKLTMRVKPSINFTGHSAITLVFNFKNTKGKALPVY